MLASSLAENLVIWILTHLLISLRDPIMWNQFASELSALDFLYGVLLEMHESENRDE